MDLAERIGRDVDCRSILNLQREMTPTPTKLHPSHLSSISLHDFFSNFHPINLRKQMQKALEEDLVDEFQKLMTANDESNRIEHTDMMTLLQVALRCNATQIAKFIVKDSFDVAILEDNSGGGVLSEIADKYTRQFSTTSCTSVRNSRNTNVINDCSDDVMSVLYSLSETANVEVLVCVFDKFMAKTASSKGESELKVVSLIRMLSCHFRFYDIELPDLIKSERLSCVDIMVINNNIEMITVVFNAAKEYGRASCSEDLIGYVSPSPSLLIHAARCGHKEIASEIISYVKLYNLNKASTYINRRYRHLTALHFAVLYNHTDVVVILLQKGNADVSADTGGCLGVPFVVSSALGHVDIVKTFIHLRPQLLARKHVEAAVRAAAATGHVSVIEVILKRFTDRTTADSLPIRTDVIDACDHKGNTALMLAIRGGHMKAADLLIKFGAVHSDETNKSISFQESSLSIIDTAATDKVLFHLRKSGIEVDYYPLNMAAKYGQIDAVQKLIQRGADPQTMNREGNTFLHVAAERNQSELIAKILPSYTFLAYVTNLQMNTALHIASEKGFVESVSALLAVAPNSIRVRNIDGNTPLHLAVVAGCSDVVQVIVAVIKDTELQFVIDKPAAPSGRTALGMAVKLRSIECIKELSCADPTKPDKRSVTPLHLAVANADVLSVFLETFYDSPKASIEDLNKADREGNTALMLCAEKGQIESMKLLLAYGANIERTNRQGETVVTVLATRFHGSVSLKFTEGWNVIKDYVCTSTANRLVESENAAHVARCQLFHLTAELFHMSSTDPREHDHHRSKVKSKVNAKFLEKASSAARIETALQFAARIGDSDNLRSMIEAISKFEWCSVTYYDLRALVSPVLYQTNLMNQSSSSSASKEPVAKKETKSCLELIQLYCSPEQMAEMLNIEPFKIFVTKFATIRTVVFTIALMMHIGYMCCFTAFTLPMFYRNSSRMPTSNEVENGTFLDRHYFASSYNTYTTNKYLALFLVWPAILALHEFHCLMKLLAAAKSELIARYWTDDSNILFLMLWGFPKVLNRKLKSSHGFELLSHLSSIGFCSIISIWCWFSAFYSTIDRNIQMYALITTVALIYGWMQTLDFVKGFPNIHAFVAMLQIIFINDILRIVFIYIFVIIGFSSSFYVHLQIEQSSPENNISYGNTLYRTFTSMLGQGSFIDDLTSESSTVTLLDSNVTMIRVIYVIYLLMSTIVLLNILIAMMNHTYDEVLGLRETLWCVESLNFITWIVQDDILWMRTICRLWINRRVIVMFRYASGTYERCSNDDVGGDDVIYAVEKKDSGGTAKQGINSTRTEVQQLRHYVERQFTQMKRENEYLAKTLRSDFTKFHSTLQNITSSSSAGERAGVNWNFIRGNRKNLINTPSTSRMVALSTTSN